MVLSSLSVVISSLALNAYRRPPLHSIPRPPVPSAAAHRRPFLQTQEQEDGDVELEPTGATTIAQGRRHQQSRSQPPALSSQHRRRGNGSVDSVASLASSLGSAEGTGGGLGALGALAALDPLDWDMGDASGGGTTALSRLWARMRGYRGLPPDYHGYGGEEGQVSVSSHRETV